MSRLAYMILAAFFAGVAGYLVATGYNVGSILTPVPQVAVFISVLAGIISGALYWAGTRWSMIALVLALAVLMVQGLSGSVIDWWGLLLLLVSLIALAVNLMSASKPTQSVRH